MNASVMWGVARVRVHGIRVITLLRTEDWGLVRDQLCTLCHFWIGVG